MEYLRTQVSDEEYKRMVRKQGLGMYKRVLNEYGVDWDQVAKALGLSRIPDRLRPLLRRLI